MIKLYHFSYTEIDEKDLASDLILFPLFTIWSYHDI